MNILKSLIVAGVVCTIATAASINSCKGCHGADFSKKALGKSKVVSDMTTVEFVAAMNGYKDGTYGGSMKGLMKGQVSKYSEDDYKDMASQLNLK